MKKEMEIRRKKQSIKMIHHFRCSYCCCCSAAMRSSSSLSAIAGNQKIAPFSLSCTYLYIHTLHHRSNVERHVFKTFIDTIFFPCMNAIWCFFSAFLSVCLPFGTAQTSRKNAYLQSLAKQLIAR